MSDVNDIDEMDPLLRRARGLNVSVEPRNDLWAGIRDRLGERGDFRWSPPRLAVAAVLLVSLSSAMTLWLGDALTDVSPAGSTDVAFSTITVAAPQFAMGPEFVQNRTDLVLSLEKKLDELSPESRKVLAANLDNIDEAINEIRTALKDDPNSELLLQLLMSTYTDQLTLLGTIDGMTRSVNERTET